MTLEPPTGFSATPAFPPSAPRPLPPEPWSVEFRGRGLQLLVIGVVNGLLNILTLGVWFAWGRIRELRFIIGNTWVDGDPLSFRGRGGELFRGVLIAFFAFILPLYALVFWASQTQGFESALLILLAYAGFAMLIAFASVGSLRYRLPRTEWRGIRFGFDGKVPEFLLGFVGRIVLVGITLGWYYPAYACWRRRWIMSRCRFGTERFACNADPGPLYGPFAACWFLGLVTLGFSMVWFTGHLQGYLWSRTRLGASRISCSMTGEGWLGLQLVNAVLALFTVGIAAPWIVVRTYRYLFSHLTLDGALDLAAIQQRVQKSGGVGEGMLDVLDLDSGLDLG